MCKMFSCRPSELRQEDKDELDLMKIVYQEIMKSNPMFMFM